MFNFKLFFVLAVLVQSIMSMGQLEDAIADETDVAEILPPDVPLEDALADQNSAEFRGYGWGYGYRRPYFGGYGYPVRRPQYYGGYRPYGYGYGYYG